MNNDLNITEEEYKQIKALEDDDSIKVNRDIIRKVSISSNKIFNYLI
jgi:hypothetical protein